MQVSRLNENLVVLFSDYITGEPFLSFIGKNALLQTVQMVIEYSKERYQLPSLKLIPECIARHLPTSEFIITEDRDSFDYIYPISFFHQLIEQPAKHKPTSHLRFFTRSYPQYQYTFRLLHEADKHELKILFKTWACNKSINHRDMHEYIAFERLLQYSDKRIFITTISVDSCLVGFMINEILANNYAICHFCKADVSYRGIYEALIWIASSKLNELGMQYLNFEQDLGMENLRRSKEKYKNHSFLKKFKLENNSF